VNEATAILIATIVSQTPIAVAALLKIIDAAKNQPEMPEELKARIQALSLSLAASSALSHQIAQAIAEDRLPEPPSS
jgi:hypothetical protein